MHSETQNKFWNALSDWNKERYMQMYKSSYENPDNLELKSVVEEIINIFGEENIAGTKDNTRAEKWYRDLAGRYFKYYDESYIYVYIDENTNKLKMCVYDLDISDYEGTGINFCKSIKADFNKDWFDCPYEENDEYEFAEEISKETFMKVHDEFNKIKENLEKFKNTLE